MNWASEAPSESIDQDRRARPGRNGPGRSLRWAAALLVAGLAAWLSIRRINWPAMEAALRATRLPLLALALGTVLLTTAAKAARWRVLLRPTEARISGARLLRILFIGQLGNIFLPARLGDMARAALAGPLANGGFPAVLGTLVVEKALDGVMGLLILAGLALGTPLPSWLRGPVLALAALTGLMLALAALAVARQRSALNLYRWLSAPLPTGMRQRLDHLLAEFALGLGLFRRPADVVPALGWSVAIWALAALTNTVTMAALGIEAPGWSTWLVLVTGYVATFLPVVPTHVGVFEYACVLALTTAGVDPAPALAFGLVLHLVVYAPPALLGPASMAIEGFRWTSLGAGRDPSVESNRAAR